MKKVYVILTALILIFGLTVRANAVSIDLSTISVDVNPVTGLETGTYSVKFTDTAPMAGLAGIVAGEYIDIAGLGSPFDGSYFVSASTHLFGTGGYSSDFTLQRNASGPLALYRPNYSFTYSTGTGKKSFTAGLSFFPVPEPSTIALLGVGLAGLLFLRRRFKTEPGSN